VLSALGGLRYAVGVPRRTVNGQALAGAVHIFDASSSVPVATINNPSPRQGDQFGGTVSPVGPDKLVVGAPLTDGVNGQNTGVIHLFDHSGALPKTIENPTQRAGENFGWATAPFGPDRFLVSAPAAAVVYFTPQGLKTNNAGGIVYLFDGSGALMRTFQSPTPATTVGFGNALHALDEDRFLVGVPSESVQGTNGAGRAFVFNADGFHLATLSNPAPNLNDSFGSPLAAVGGDRAAIAAPFDDTRQSDAGSVYIYDLPVARYDIGSEIPRPDNVDVSGAFPQLGPRVEPAEAAFWHVPSQKLFLVQSGDILVSWPLIGGQTNHVQAFGAWPTNESKYQIYIATAPPVDLSDGGPTRTRAFSPPAAASTPAKSNQPAISTRAPRDRAW
jgi:hypothetical protein